MLSSAEGGASQLPSVPCYASSYLIVCAFEPNWASPARSSVDGCHSNVWRSAPRNLVRRRACACPGIGAAPPEGTFPDGINGNAACCFLTSLLPSSPPLLPLFPLHAERSLFDNSLILRLASSASLSFSSCPVYITTPDSPYQQNEDRIRSQLAQRSRYPWSGAEPSMLCMSAVVSITCCAGIES